MGRPRKQERYHLYTDGSYFINEGRMGVGWVISRESNGKYIPGMRRLLLNGKSSSSLAEIYAVTLALHRLRSDSTVVVHTDDLSLSNLLNEKNFENNIARTRKPERATALSLLFNAVNVHKSVESLHERQESSEHLTRAHHLARAACWLRPLETLQSVSGSPRR